MRLQTMSNIGSVLEELVVGRGDPVYMAHGYLTKVPVPAILPFIDRYTDPGQIVVDPFAGSGMTGVAAAILGRTGRLYDISVLGQHIGRNYLNLVDGKVLRKQADDVVTATRQRVGELYAADCDRCGAQAELTKATWSAVFRCGGCDLPINYYRALEAANWSKPKMVCPACGESVTTKLDRLGEEPVIDSITCDCSSKQLDQAPSVGLQPDVERFGYPRVEITPDRQMYQAQSLGKSGLTTVASFYSSRNLAVLTVLREEIAKVTDDDLRNKLLFAFTASLTRASKRYQWSHKRPLNAANANYYVAPVFYEWNVYDLFLRKVEAAIRSDEWIAQQRAGEVLFSPTDDIDVTYELSNVEHIPLPDHTVDYIFTDPPFGSNLFYADMALFQEAWLDGFTDVKQEAVINRGSTRKTSAMRYEAILVQALRECRRILKPDGHVSMVFGNSTGSVWSLVQRAIAAAGLVVEPEALVILNKGQRSVKGLASGFEHVATLDLILTLRPAADGQAVPEPVEATHVVEATKALALESKGASPSHLYLELLRRGFREGWDLSKLDLRTVTSTLLAQGWEVDEQTGRLRRDRVA